MAFQFPASPTVNQTFTPVAGVTYRWSGTAWHLLAGPGAFITQAEGDARYLQQAGADALYVNVNEVPNIQNRIINGKFAIDQRNAGAEVAAGLYPVDRFSVPALPAVVTSMATGRKVLNPGHYLMVKATVAQPSTATSETVIRQVVEGLNLADLAYGTASASPLTLAFEVRSTIAGTGTVAIRGATTLQYYVTTFPVTTSFTTVVVTVPGATTGTWEVGTGPGFYVDWGLTVGSNYVASAVSTAWAVGGLYSVTGATNFMATVGNEYHLRNVRLYKGSVDFGPDRRLYAEELALCQRYYEKSYDINVAPGTASAFGFVNLPMPPGTVLANNGIVGRIQFQTRKRAAPTMTIRPFATPSNLNRVSTASGVDLTASSGVSTGPNVSETGASVQNNSGGTITADAIGTFICHYEASAEL